ncbi:antirestriction protein ArdA [Fodinicola acaciae]|uniref:antirestriction protein ArdA n=1 Tax=Fodinicola acaciae TaxID=2681555 RepID=UPI0013D68EF9|nr:antirestriction protein ArdA [Fodinicola acaciae]
MERTPTPGGEHDYLTAIPPDEGYDERVIREGIGRALRDSNEIDDRTARYIASQLHEGQASAMYSLASTGAISEAIHNELTAGYDDLEPRVQWWVNWLGAYCLNRPSKAAVADWVELAEAQDRAELIERISAAAVTTLGQVATVIDPARDEVDSFPWTDASRWRPDDVEDEATSDLDDLFLLEADDGLSMPTMGWFRLIRHQDRTGGYVIGQNNYGQRHSWETDSDDELHTYWETLERQYDAFEQATTSRSEVASSSGHTPQVWVGSLSDYNDGELHGAWLDATLEPDELHDAVQFILRNGYHADAEEWAILDHSDFCGFELDEYASFAAVSRIARGIATHGEAFAHWVGYVGETDEELLTDEAFQDHFEGEYDSLEGYVEYILSETGFYTELEQALAVIPEDLRRYVKLDTTGVAEEWNQGLHVIDADSGRVLVFDARG